MLDQIEKVVSSDIRPLLKAHQGDLKVLSLEDGVVTIKLLGACTGCPQSDLTTKDLIEDRLCSMFPWVKKVELFKEMDPTIIEMAKKILNRNDRV